MKIRILLKEAREKKGYNYSQMGKLLKLSSHTPYLLIETCKREASIQMWKKIQKILEIKDSNMWIVITTYKYVENPSKNNKINI